MLPDSPTSFPSAKPREARSPATCKAGWTVGANSRELKRQRNQKLGVGVAIPLHCEAGCQPDSSRLAAAQAASSPVRHTHCWGENRNCGLGERARLVEPNPTVRAQRVPIPGRPRHVEELLTPAFCVRYLGFFSNITACLSKTPHVKRAADFALHTIKNLHDDSLQPCTQPSTGIRSGSLACTAFSRRSAECRSRRRILSALSRHVEHGHIADVEGQRQQYGGYLARPGSLLDRRILAMGCVKISVLPGSWALPAWWAAQLACRRAAQ